jgi:N-acetylmuramoyl-L-alanine amidase
LLSNNGDPANHGNAFKRVDRQTERIRAKADRLERQVERKSFDRSEDKPEASARDQREAALATASPLAGFVISVDPGHNGGNASDPAAINRQVVAYADGATKACNTTGTETNDGSLTESAFNFDLAVVLEMKLRALGATVVTTRTNDSGVGPCINERAEIANRAHADAAISIHADGNYGANAHGFDVIHPASDEMVNPSMAGPSLKLATDLRNALVATGVPPANYVGKFGLDARDDLGGLNLSKVPAVLAEMGNMRSETEAAQLESSAYRERLAEALVAGIVAFLRPYG